jgi:hypothetical protein
MPPSVFRSHLYRFSVDSALPMDGDFRDRVRDRKNKGGASWTGFRGPEQNRPSMVEALEGNLSWSSATK